MQQRRYKLHIFENVECALARTIPFMDEVEPAQEVRHMLLDLIGEAESVIYIENQFTTRQEIAERLWQEEDANNDVLRSHIYQLRNQLDKPFHQPMLVTVPKVGFRLERV